MAHDVFQGRIRRIRIQHKRDACTLVFVVALRDDSNVVSVKSDNRRESEITTSHDDGCGYFLVRSEIMCVPSFL